MSRKRRPSGHQQQIRFFTIFFGTLMVLAVAVLIWLFNRPPGGAH